MAWLLALALSLSLVPVTALADGEETGTFAKITEATDFEAGTYLIHGISSAAIDDGTTSGFVTIAEATSTRLMASDFAITDDTVTTSDTSSQWEFTEVTDGFTIKNVNTGDYLYYGSHTGNNIYHETTLPDGEGNGVWSLVADENGTFHLQEKASGRQLGTNAFGSSPNKYIGFAAYATNSSVSRAVELYKLQAGTATPKAAKPTASEVSGSVYVKDVDTIPSITLTAAEGASIYYTTDGTAPTTESTEYTAPIPLVDGVNTIKAIATETDKDHSAVATFTYTVLAKSTIAEAREASSGTLAVEGVVTFADGKNIMVEDSSNGINLYFAASAPGLVPGDKVVAIGTRGDNKGLPQLTISTYTKGATGQELPCADATLANVESFMCRRVKLTGLTLGTVDTTGNTVVTDSDGNSANIYKIPELGEDAVPGATVTVTAVVSCYNNTMQLRVAEATDVEVTAPPAKVQAPTATPASGNVGQGAKITFATTTADATIQYKVGDGEWVTGDSYTVPDDAAFESEITITVKATHATLAASDEATFTYTVKDSLLKTGDNIVIYNPANNKFLSGTYSGFYNVGVDVTMAEGKPTGFTRAEIWVVTANADGTYSFATLDGGGKLSMAAEKSSMPLNDTHDKWSVEEVSGGYFFKNVGRSQYIEWYADRGYWSAYGNTSNAALFTHQFYKLTADEIPALPVEAPTFSPASGSVEETSVTVTISCETEGASIYYTTDGTTPTTASAAYTAPIVLDLSGGAVTVKAIATKAGMAASDVASKTYQHIASDTDFIPVTTAEEIAVEGYFVIIPKNFDTKAMGNSFAKKPTGVDVTLADGTYAPTLKFAPMDDGISIQYEATGKYLSYSGKGTDFEESDTPFKYTITANDDGTVRLIPNNATNRAISYRGAGDTGVFAPYTTSNDGRTDDYGTYECDMLVYKSRNGYLYDPQISFGTKNDAVPDQDYVIGYSTTDTDQVSAVAAQYSLDNETWNAATVDTIAQTVTVPGSAIADTDKLYLKITATDTRGDKTTDMSATAEITVINEPIISTVSPANGSETGEGNLKPTITVTVLNGGTFTAKITLKPKTGAAITDAEMTVSDGTATYTPAADLAEGWCEVSVTITRNDEKTVTKNWGFTVGKAVYRNFFGQLHSHTAEYSDGAGTLANALEYIKNTAYRNNVQFVAFTDHSNYFDSTADVAPEAALYDTSLLSETALTKWNTYRNTVAQFNLANAGSMVAIAGFEMTWSGGPGHINTFNTPGIVSRNNKTLNNKTNDGGMKAYYDLLKNDKGVDSISQFNHPGTTFGTFSEFAHYDSVIDSRITLVEVGNGEGAIGSGGYFPSYSEYIKALDKGWHLAPTNNQDNHKGHWGDSNDARTVICTTDLNEQAIYQAMRDMRLYATEDKNLDIVYTVNGEMLGTIVEEVPASVTFKATISDPDSTDKIATVEIVTNGGAVVYKVEDVNAASYELDHTLDDPKAGYYFLRVTEADKDIAVTAPVWLGKAKAVGMSELTTATYMAVKDEPLTVTNQFFNNEKTAATIKSLTYKVGDATVVTNTEEKTIASEGTLDNTFTHTFTDVGEQTLTLIAVIEVGGETKTLQSSLTLNVKDPDSLIYIGVDGSHHNEYVTGNYKDSMTNFGTVAAGYDVRVNVLNTSEELLAALENPKYKMMVFTAPTRRLELTSYDVYSDAELAAIAQFAQNGGTVIVSGWGDYYESYDYCPKDADMQMSAQQNNILKAIGSSLRVADDEAKDPIHKPDANQAGRLYLIDYNGFQNELLAGVDQSQVWSQYGGSSIYAVDANGDPSNVLPESVVPMISGYGKYESDGTGIDIDQIDSYDDDHDGYMNGVADKTVKPPKYQSDKGLTCLLTATETITYEDGTTSLVMVSGGAFMSNFEIKFEADNTTQLGYSNLTVLENLIDSLNPPTITDIATVQETGEEGQEFTVEGVITANTSGYDRDTAFFDCTYVQDDTAGINIFPVSDSFQIGQKVRVTGTITSYQGEKELTVKSIRFRDRRPAAVTPTKVTTAEAASGDYLGSLIEVQGTVTSVELAEGLVQTIRLVDDSEQEARVFIDGYITTSKDAALQRIAKVGAKIKVVGIASYDDTFKEDGSESNRIRIRDRADITAVGSTRPAVTTTDPTDTTQVTENEDGSVTTTVTAPDGTVTETTVAVDGSTVEKVTDPEENVTIVATDAEGEKLAEVVIPATIPEPETRFEDVPEGHWADEAIHQMAAIHAVEGTGDNRYTMDAGAKRGDLATILYRLSNSPAESENLFTDVDGDAYYAKGVAWAAKAGIVEGYDDATFKPERIITREQMALMLMRYAKLLGMDTKADVEALNDFTDGADTHDWAAEGVAWCIQNGILRGKGEGILDPTANVTRAQVAVMLQRFLDLAR